jgi:hypothetical protein
MYVAIKVMATVYILYKLWMLLVVHKANGFWNFVTPKAQKRSVREVSVEKEATEVADATCSVIGKSRTLPVTEQAVPDFIGEEADIDPEEVDCELSPRAGLEGEDLFIPAAESSPDASGDYSTGKTFGELSEVAEVVRAAHPEDVPQEKRVAAARTLWEVRQTDMYAFFATQLSNTAAVERLMKECLDGDGMPREKPRPDSRRKPFPGDFDIDSFVPV